MNRLNSDIERKRFLEYVSSEKTRVKVILNMQDDEIKKESLVFLKSENSKVKVIASLRDDEYKINYLKSANLNDAQRGFIVKGLENDDLKKEFIKGLDEKINAIEQTITEEEKKATIEMGLEESLEKNPKIKKLYSVETLKAYLISSLKDDNFKKEYLENEYMDSIFGKFIIASLEDDEYKINYLESIKDDSEIASQNASYILASLKDKDEIRRLLPLFDYNVMVNTLLKIPYTEIKQEFLDQVKDESGKALILASIDDDSIKEDCLTSIKDEDNRIIIITSFKDNAVKLHYLKREEHKLIDEPKRIKEILLSMENIDEIKEYIKNYSDEYDRTELVKAFSNDKLKEECLPFFKSQLYRSALIVSIGNDKIKEDYLDSFEEELDRTSIISSFKSDKLKEKYLESIQNESNRAFIISTFKSDILKEKYLESMQDESNRELIILTIKNDKIKVKCIKSIHDIDTKYKLILKIFDDTYKIEALKQFDEYDTDEIDKMRIEEYRSNILFSLKDFKLAYPEILKIPTFRNCDAATIVHMYEEKIVSPITYLKAKTLLEDKSKLLPKDRKYNDLGLDPKLTIGTEIEAEGRNADTIKQMSKIIEEGIKNWSVKNDGSLSKGVEAVSPIMTNNPNDIENIYAMCGLLKELEFKTSRRCGGHIHIGADYLTSIESYKNLAEIWGNTEKIIYLLANEKGTLPRDGIINFAKPISKHIEEKSVDLKDSNDVDEFVNNLLQQYSETSSEKDRYCGINFCNLIGKDRKNTIEFRLPNGTIDPEIWIQNIMFFGRMIQRSEELTLIANKPEEERTPEEKQLLELKEKLTQEIPEDEKAETLISLLLDEKDRQIFRDRYNANKQLASSKKSNLFDSKNFSKPFNFKDIKDTTANVGLASIQVAENNLNNIQEGLSTDNKPKLDFE